MIMPRHWGQNRQKGKAAVILKIHFAGLTPRKGLLTLARACGLGDRGFKIKRYLNAFDQLMKEAPNY